jgi:hypothetical protein
VPSRDYEAEIAGRGATGSWHVKFLRARDHLQWLDTELQWLEREQAAHLFATQTDPYTHDVVIKVERPDPLPLRWQAVVGDCLQNFRHSLDHVVWRLAQLALDGQQLPLTTEFPIFIDAEKFTADKARKIGSLRPETQTLIETLQPYNAGYEPLWTLHELARRDKHRALLLAARVLTGGHITIRGGAQSYTESMIPGPLIAGTEVARIPASLIATVSAPGGKMEMEHHLPSVVAFDEPEVFPAGYIGVLPTLRTIENTVARTIDTLQRAFGIPNFGFPPGPS